MATELEQAETQEHTTDNSGEGNQPSSTPNTPPANPPRSRRRLLIPLGIFVLILIGVGIWWLNASNFEDTDDAQVDGHMNPISSRISGTVQAVHVDDNQRVQAGQQLVELDPRDYEVALAQAKADFGQAASTSTAEKPNLPITLVGNRTDAATGRGDSRKRGSGSVRRST